MGKRRHGCKQWPVDAEAEVFPPIRASPISQTIGLIPMQAPQHESAKDRGRRVDGFDARAHGPLAAALRVLAQAGYGLWMLLGLALAFGVFRTGRGESLVPLAVGAILVSLGLLLASLRRPWSPAWLGWQPGRRAWPTRSALLGMATYLPMLAVAGLTRGDNAFWATRAVGAALMLCALATLIYDRRAAHRGTPMPFAGLLETLLFAGYSGGLWLWLFASADTSVSPGEANHPWVLPLLVLAVLLGGVESVRWRVRPIASADAGTTLSGNPRGSRHLITALLVYAVPCAALVFSEMGSGSTAVALLVMAACLIGRLWEQRLYDRSVHGHARA